jgi:UDP-N-acetylglucosamine 2-epimerase (non-hydrolysing)/GDP/UDP-N,N'-diacetylbacillosamine 2-epimerase (hydrolysing)
MREIARSRRLGLQVIAAGMHLSREFGHTIDDISADGFSIDARVEMLPETDSPAAMADATGRGIVGFTRAFKRLKPDVVVVLGDRIEAFAATTAAVLSRRVVAHIHGGDRAEGGFDDYMRHAITKMAHLHFAATKSSARRIARLGERKDRIFIVGAPGLDEIRPTRLPSAAATKRKLGFKPSEPLVLCVQHSVSTHGETAAAEMSETLEALEVLALPTLVVYPNSDAGGRAIARVIKAFEKRNARNSDNSSRRMLAFRSLPRHYYLSVMKAASLMVGNSSSGIIEAASLRLPVVNVGRRQAGRERSGNTVDAPCDKRNIMRAIGRVLADGEFRRKLKSARNIYGDGEASRRIARILAEIPLTPDIYTKQIVY